MKNASVAEFIIRDVLESSRATSVEELSKQIVAELAMALEARREAAAKPKRRASLALVTPEWSAANPAPRKSRANPAVPFKLEIVR